MNVLVLVALQFGNIGHSVCHDPIYDYGYKDSNYYK
jgi:hypothetical protein